MTGTGTEPFGPWLRRYMANQQPPITPAELARRIDTSHTTIGRWLNDQSQPSPANLRAMAPILGLTFGELLARAGYGAEASTVVDDTPADPLITEIGRMLAPDSPLGDDRRRELRSMLLLLVESHRPHMRRRRAG